jgi:apolipoprotein N-acyltransferase
LFLLGLVISLASIPNPLIYLPLGILIGFVPLFIFNQRFSGWRSFLINIIFFELFAVCLLVPLDAGNLVYVFPATLFLIVILSIVAFTHALFLSFAGSLSGKYGWYRSPLFFGATSCMLQYFLSYIPFGITFPVETALAPFPIMIQSARVFGPYFVIFLIIFTNALLANAFVKNDKRTWTISLSILLLVHSVNFGYGCLSLNSSQDPGKPVNIAVIQMNITSKDYELKERNKFFEKIMDKKLISLSMDALDKRPDLIIWPELSGDFILQNDEYLSCLHKNITSKGAELLIGTTYIDYCENKKKYNIAFILKTDGDMTEPYRKTKIFPFFETQWLSRGNEYVTLPSSTALKNIGCMICLESIYPQIARGLARSGAKALVCISTDTAFGNSMIPYIHSTSMVFRAIENNMYGIHVGNTGPSIICDNMGRIITQIPYGKTAYANAVVYPIK